MKFNETYTLEDGTICKVLKVNRVTVDLELPSGTVMRIRKIQLRVRRGA